MKMSRRISSFGLTTLLCSVTLMELYEVRSPRLRACSLGAVPVFLAESGHRVIESSLYIWDQFYQRVRHIRFLDR